MKHENCHHNKVSMKVRTYSSGDEEAILELDARELPSEWNPRTIENWFWKFTDRNPAGSSFIWVAEHNRQMIAHFAAVPFPLKVLNEEITASHSIGALVDAKYQKRGLLKVVADKLLEELGKNSIPFTWGFPNQRAYSLHKVVLDYKDLINFHEWKLESQKFDKPSYLSSASRVIEFDDDFNQLWETCSADYPIAIVRNKAHLNWRYIQRPDWKYFPYCIYTKNHLRGYVILKLFREGKILRGHIVDLFARRDDEDTLSQLIDKALISFSESAVDEITVWIWGNPLVDTLLTKKGFTKIAKERPLVLRENVVTGYRDQILDASNWYFTMGDSTEIF